LGAVVWVHYAPPLADSMRKTYRQLLHWNDELPFVKFAVADEERPMLSAEIAAPVPDARRTGSRHRPAAGCLRPALTQSRPAGSTGWANRRPLVPAKAPRLLDRYAKDLGELVTPDYDEVRTAARVILIDPADRVLLLGARDPADNKVVWVRARRRSGGQRDAGAGRRTRVTARRSRRLPG
jgi:hypothetical protein